MQQMKTHFEKLKVSVDITGIITYLESQAEMMSDKRSEKYLRMKKIVEKIKIMQDSYNEIFDENTRLIDMAIEKNPNDEHFTKCLSEQYSK